jgi:hypothetical protein
MSVTVGALVSQEGTVVFTSATSTRQYREALFAHDRVSTFEGDHVEVGLPSQSTPKGRGCDTVNN